jgi:hypothetical protein
MSNKPRESLLNKKYGKFDLIEKELATEDILYGKPRAVLELICEKFDLEKSEIKKVTFYKWLSRAKKEIVKNETKFKWKPGQNKETSIDVFQPTDPLASTGASKIKSTIILKRPIYSK